MGRTSTRKAAADRRKKQMLDKLFNSGKKGGGTKSTGRQRQTAKRRADLPPLVATGGDDDFSDMELEYMEFEFGFPKESKSLNNNPLSEYQIMDTSDDEVEVTLNPQGQSNDEDAGDLEDELEPIKELLEHMMQAIELENTPADMAAGNCAVNKSTEKEPEREQILNVGAGSAALNISDPASWAEKRPDDSWGKCPDKLKPEDSKTQGSPTQLSMDVEPQEIRLHDKRTDMQNQLVNPQHKDHNILKVDIQKISFDTDDGIPVNLGPRGRFMGFHSLSKLEKQKLERGVWKLIGSWKDGMLVRNGMIETIPCHGIINKQINIFFRKLGFETVALGCAFRCGNTIIIKAGYVRMITGAPHNTKVPNLMTEEQWSIIRDYYKKNFQIIILISHDYVDPKWMGRKKKWKSRLNFPSDNDIPFVNTEEKQSHIAALVINGKTWRLHDSNNFADAEGDFIQTFYRRVRRYALGHILPKLGASLPKEVKPKKEGQKGKKRKPQKKKNNIKKKNAVDYAVADSTYTQGLQSSCTLTVLFLAEQLANGRSNLDFNRTIPQAQLYFDRFSWHCGSHVKFWEFYEIDPTWETVTKPYPFESLMQELLEGKDQYSANAVAVKLRKLLQFGEVIPKPVDIWKLKKPRKKLFS